MKFRKINNVGSSVVEHPLMVWWVNQLIPHGGPLSYFLFQPILHDWCVKGHGIYPVCGMVHIKEPLLLIRKLQVWIELNPLRDHGTGNKDMYNPPDIDGSVQLLVVVGELVDTLYN